MMVNNNDSASTKAKTKKKKYKKKEMQMSRRALTTASRARATKKGTCKYEAGGSYHACDCGGFWATASRALGKELKQRNETNKKKRTPCSHTRSKTKCVTW